MDEQKTKDKSSTKNKHSSKHVKDVPVSKRRRLLTVFKIIFYSFIWLMAWSAIAFGMAVVLIMSVVFSIAPDGVITPQQANNSVLAVILIVGALFLVTVWLMRKAKSLFYRTSRYVLLVCTVIGLLAGIPMSLLGVWQPDVDSSNSAATIDEKKPKLERYQYMLCSDGSYRMYTDEQMKTPGVGFTDESQDNCEENEQGKMLQLTNSLEEAKANSQKPAATQQAPLYPVKQSQRSEPSCFDYVIYYDYKKIDSDEYTVGRGKTIQDGVNGEGVRCYENGNVISDKVVKEPINHVYISGTRESSSSGGYNGGNSHSCGYYASLGLANSTYAAGCTP